MSELKNTPLLYIEVKDFITRIQTSKARKAIYYEQHGKHPVPSTKLKHLNKGKFKYGWGKFKTGNNYKTLLWDIANDCPVLKNARSVGTPKYLAIKGNNIYSGFGGYRTRVIIMNGIKDNLRPYFKGKQITEFPIYLHFTIHDELNMTTSAGKSQTQDLDNLFTCYIKAIQDLMKAEGVIPDDNLQFIRKSTYEFIESKEKKLIIKAFKYK